MSEDKPDIPKIEMLEAAPHFAFLTFEDKSALVKHTRLEEFMPGDALIHEGEELGTIYFIFDGKVEVIKTSAMGRRVALAELGRGEIVGESALYPDQSHATVLVRAVEKTKALALDKDDFKVIVKTSPSLAFNLLFDMMRLLRRRLNDVSNRLADHLADHD